MRPDIAAGKWNGAHGSGIAVPGIGGPADKRSAKRLRDRVVPAPSAIHGDGYFASVPFKAVEHILTYRGRAAPREGTHGLPAPRCVGQPHGRAERSQSAELAERHRPAESAYRRRRAEHVDGNRGRIGHGDHTPGAAACSSAFRLAALRGRRARFRCGPSARRGELGGHHAIAISGLALPADSLMRCVANAYRRDSPYRRPPRKTKTLYPKSPQPKSFDHVGREATRQPPALGLCVPEPRRGRLGRDRLRAEVGKSGEIGCAPRTRQLGGARFRILVN
jgi:hypothetical protein